jgi:hypothetical protein
MLQPVDFAHLRERDGCDEEKLDDVAGMRLRPTMPPVTMGGGFGCKFTCCCCLHDDDGSGSGGALHKRKANGTAAAAGIKSFPSLEINLPAF